MPQFMTPSSREYSDLQRDRNALQDQVNELLDAAEARRERLVILQNLSDKWESEAANYERRTNDDYTAHAMMLRYC